MIGAHPRVGRAIAPCAPCARAGAKFASCCSCVVGERDVCDLVPAGQGWPTAMIQW